MPRKAAASKSPEPAEEAGVPIIVRRQIMKDDAAAVDENAGGLPASETTDSETTTPRSKKGRIEPLNLTPVADVQPAAAEAASETPAEASKTEAAATATEATPTPPASESPAEQPPAKAEAPSESEQPAAKTSTPATATEPAEKTAEGAGDFNLGGTAVDEDTPDDPSQNPIDQAKAKADKEAAEKQAALDKLVEAQTYFLPLNSVEKRRTKQLLWLTLLFVVVLAGAGAFWANGQGIISVPGL